MSVRNLAAGLPHLVRRFFGHLTAAPLTPAEQDTVNARLRPEERTLFWSLTPPDQRHSLEAAQRAAASRPHDPTAFRAMLLHDVGKRHASLGAIGRSLATLAEATRLPLPPGWRTYRDHGPLGSADLAAVGAEPLVVAYAANHGRERPPSIDPELWAALEAADEV